MAQNGRLANGVYAVEKGNAKAKNLVIRQYEGRDVVLDTANFAPLVVESKPEVNRDSRGSWLTIRGFMTKVHRYEPDLQPQELGFEDLISIRYAYQYSLTPRARSSVILAIPSVGVRPL